MRFAVAVASIAAWVPACGDNERPDCGGAPADCRASCSYGSGDGANLTLRDYPIGSAIPLDHLILVMQENRTFDHYFSSLTVPGGPR